MYNINAYYFTIGMQRKSGQVSGLVDTGMLYTMV